MEEVTPEVTPRHRGRWRPGESGNPKGRPRGVGEPARIRAMIAERMPGIIERLIESAEAGDVRAARLLMEKCLPTVRPVELGTALELPDGTLTEQGKAVLGAISEGAIGVGEGERLLRAIASMARVIEADNELHSAENWRRMCEEMRMAGSNLRIDL